MASTLNQPNQISQGFSPFPSSPAGSNFMPRKEFAPEPAYCPSSFALAAFTSNNMIRLSNFSSILVKDMKDRLDSIIGVHSFQENSERKLCEIVLIGKPWSNAKSLSTEILLYGKEHYDRINIAFCRPEESSNLRLVPFALSFTSSTTVRVVCSPLHETPAILQSVRSAWPKGVLSEKKIGEHCYEFKLKGHFWFNQDHFAEDVLTFMLTVLTSLDKHRWRLITSISLSSHFSRNRDLWIFSGSVSDMLGSTAHSPLTPINLGSPLRPTVHDRVLSHRKEGSASVDEQQTPNTGHSRSATEPQALLSKNDISNEGSKLTHGRSASNAEGYVGPRASINRSLGKHSPFLKRDVASSMAMGPSSNAIAVGSVSSQLPSNFPPHSFPTSLSQRPKNNYNESGENGNQHEVDENMLFPDVVVSTSTVAPELNTLDLLSPTAFQSLSGSDECRTSTVSEVTKHSLEMPMTWIPDEQQFSEVPGNSKDKEEVPTDISRRLSPSEFPQGVLDSRQSFTTTRTETTMGPFLPGAWVNTPAVEQDQSFAQQTRSSTPHSPTPTEQPRQSQIVCYSPQVVNPNLLDPKNAQFTRPRQISEAGEMGVIPMMTSIPDIANPTETRHGTVDNIGQSGWIPVNIDTSTSRPTTPQSTHVVAIPTMSSSQVASSNEATAERVNTLSRAPTPCLDIPRGSSPSSKASSSRRPGKSIFGRFLNRRISSRRPIDANASAGVKRGTSKKSNTAYNTAKD